MEKRYEKKNGKQTLILSSEKKSEDSYRIRMMRENQIRGCIPCMIHWIDEQCYFYYDITSLRSLKEILEQKEMNKEMLICLLETIADIYGRLEEFLLPPDGILMDMDLIFGTPDDRAFQLCYYPEKETSFSESMKELSEEILPRLDHNDREAVVIGYTFYQSCMEEGGSIKKLEEILSFGMDKREPISDPDQYKSENGHKIFEEDFYEQKKQREREIILDDLFCEYEEDEEEKKAGIFQIVIGVTAILTGLLLAWKKGLEIGLGAAILIGAGGYLILRLYRKYMEKTEEKEKLRQEELRQEKPKQEEKENLSESMDSPEWWYEKISYESEPEQRDAKRAIKAPVQREDEQENAEGGRETVLLSRKEYGNPKAWLVVTEEAGENIGKRKIFLKKSGYLLGKSKKMADICLNSEAVSRMHARLSWERDTYCLFDLRSKNGTYLNEEALLAEEGKYLKDGDQITMADCTLIYHKAEI
jgi:hypothetical protein